MPHSHSIADQTNNRNRKTPQDEIQWETPSWFARARCLGLALKDPEASDAFFFPSGKTVSKGRAVMRFCGNCPVREECEEWGAGNIYGFWGGIYSAHYDANGTRRKS